MMEQHYAFIKDNRVANIAVFAEQNEELADSIARQQGYDDAVWVGDNRPTMYSLWNGSEFIEPTYEELIQLGIVTNIEIAPEQVPGTNVVS